MAYNLRFLPVGLFDNLTNLERLQIKTILSRFSDKLRGFLCKSQRSA